MWRFPMDFSINGQMSIFDFQYERNKKNQSGFGSPFDSYEEVLKYYKKARKE